ncbi:ornithine cyclodeaminase [Clostridium cellulovorans]|uniref:Ornithine cyclodeaminase/mu-crystallin n=1 Tax=Clostridium cellulovorans (strain ATCC 35296 / DSM 3052 / OCM 3 / 743B) TaxID=573061 RepID=D9SU82_CLOC7|nr:ornithine cyclodeaminase [Clostridium cellulovorans]ADL52837.1 ornithine cyclodeaminase/mu-crystallin [Clostridium cellulovorans 743B]
MLYLNEKDISSINFNWNELINCIEEATDAINNNETVQPIKPYLRFNDMSNRIIAMPAYVGGNIQSSGIKWIASFPKNINFGIPRAHSVIVLNDIKTGEPEAIINTALISMFRTASVSGTLIKYFDKVRHLKDVNVGIIGWGPIGQTHYKMCKEILGEKIKKICIYDIKFKNNSNSEIENDEKLKVCDSWEEVYKDSDIFITCTVADKSYINLPPKKGSLILNVSLRDFKTDVYEQVKNSIIVDDWEEVCRENTDIENFSKEKGLLKEMTKSIVDVVCNNCLKDYKDSELIMFNPMGMAIYDVAIAKYFYKFSLENNIGYLDK